jgi:hypothetical protein
MSASSLAAAGEHHRARGRDGNGLTFGPASGADVVEFYGRLPLETMRAVVIRLDGRPVALLGVARNSLFRRFFSEYKPELEPLLKSMTVLRAIKAAMAIVREQPGTVWAVAEHAEGARVLQRLGFEHELDEVYAWRS